MAVSPAFTAAGGVDGAAMLELARLNGQEGVVAKRLLSRYRPGERSPDWIKQPLREVATVLVCGWVGSETRLEALLLAAPHPEGGVRYLGHVGTGFTAVERRDLLRLMVVRERSDHPLDTAPPHAAAGARWVQPDLVGEVHYREFTGRLRHASWRGLRTDVDTAAAQWPT
ncbi:hypothetical protein ACQ7HM_20960 [Williamsia sp. MIQD14]|uniref:ATP dependent DNA ligase n=1 Tax=Williamsia sp. MIQD14 TaxID=3425703 RepID=UPI003D9FD5B3